MHVCNVNITFIELFLELISQVSSAQNSIRLIPVIFSLSPLIHPATYPSIFLEASAAGRKQLRAAAVALRPLRLLGGQRRALLGRLAALAVHAVIHEYMRLSRVV